MAMFENVDVIHVEAMDACRHLGKGECWRCTEWKLLSGKIAEIGNS